jgi:EmrB/QacA subfamily drug resistance transporter
VDDARAKRLTLIACILGSAIVFVDQTVVNVALPALRDDLDASLADQQWVVEAYLLLLASLVLVGGSLGDLYGRRRIFAIGVAGFGTASLLCAVAPSIAILIAARALQGAFGALLVPNSLAIITTVFKADERPAAIGSWTAGTSAAIAVGPPLGGLLVDVFSWRVIFALNVPLVLVCLSLIRRAVAECPGEGRQRIDVPGTLLCVLGLAGPTWALIQGPQLGWSNPDVWIPMFGGIGALIAFLAYERIAPYPMLAPAIFRSRNFAVGNAVTFATYAGLGAATFYVALFLQQIAGYGALEAGLTLTPITLLLISLSRRFGALATRVGPRLLVTAGPIVGGLGLLAFARMDARADYLTDVLPATLLFGLGLAMTVAPLTATVLDAVDRRHAGIASGVNNAVAPRGEPARDRGCRRGADGAVRRADRQAPGRRWRRSCPRLRTRGAQAPADASPACSDGADARGRPRGERRGLPDGDRRCRPAHDRRRPACHDRHREPATRGRDAAAVRVNLGFPAR